MRHLSGQDAAFLYLESRGAHLHVTALYVYEQPKRPFKRLGHDEIVRHIVSRLGSSPLFRQKLAKAPFNLDFPYWIDDPDFDPDKHLLRYPGPAPADFHQLFDALAALHAKPLDLDRPPWEMHIIEKLGRMEGLPASCFAIIARYHHAAIDGASGMQLVDGLHASGPTAEFGDGPTDWQARREPGRVELLARAAMNNLGNQLRLTRSVLATAPGLTRWLVREKFHDQDPSSPVPDTRFNGPVSAERTVHAVSLDLAELGQIRRLVPGATVNDVVLAICGGALRMWLEAEQELPDDSLVSMVPVNARTPTDADRGGNRLSALFLPIGTDLADPLERLQAVHRASGRAKSETRAIDPRHVSDITSHIPAPSLAAISKLVTGLGLGYRLGRLCNCTITNVPGTRTAQYLGPARLVYSTGSAPIIDGMGLIITVFSYLGKITFAVTSCPAMLPEPESLARCIVASFDRLREKFQEEND